MTVVVPEMWRSELLCTRELPGRGLCAIQRFAYTCALLVDVTFDDQLYDYKARYCYHGAFEAIEALDAWNGSDDPPGEWIKEKVSGRSRTPLLIEVER